MAIVPMQKIRLLAHARSASGIFDYIQKKGVVDFREVEHPEFVRKEKEVFEFNYVHSRLDFAVEFLSKYEEARKKIEVLVNGDAIPVAEGEFEDILHTFSFNEIIDEVIQTQENINVATRKEAELREEYILLDKWRAYPAKLNAFETEHTDIIFAECSVAGNTDDVKLAFSDSKLTYHFIDISDNRFVVVVLKKDGIEARHILKSFDIEITKVPRRRGSPEEEIERVNRALYNSANSKEKLQNKARALAKDNLRNLRILSDYILWKKEKHDIVSGAYGLGNVLVFEGWCPEEEVPALRDEIAEQTKLADLSVILPSDGEEPPVEIKNNTLVKPFESVTRLYGLPGHKDLDPTVFLAGFFFLFFGFSLTDVGYGVFLAMVTGLSLIFFKIPDDTKTLVRLLFMGGIASVLVGFLFGGYLGINPELLPGWLQALQKFDPISDPLPVFYLSLALGVLQMMFGIVLRIVSEARNGRFTDGLLDNGPWLLLFVALILFVLESIGLIGGGNMIFVLYAALIILAVSGGRHGETILQKIFKGFLSLYGIIGYFSDVLSYSRLLALGLATSALAFAINLIAGLIGEMIPIIGPVIAICILIAGHLFNLTVNTLGAFIHSARLQFVEFFGKFVSGTGENFRPFKRQPRYVSVIE